MLRDGRKKEEKKKRRTNEYFRVFVFRFPRSKREFTAEVTCSFCLHHLPRLPSLSSKKESHVHVARHDSFSKTVSVIAVALARQLSSLSFRLSCSSNLLSFALLRYGLCKFFSGLLRHARCALIDPNHSHLYSPYCD